MGNKKLISKQIKDHAISLGFDACGICKAEAIDFTERDHYVSWIKKNYHADMEYLVRNSEKRFDPTLLVENSCSVISVALNYYPEIKQQADVPQFAYYAYGMDYHDVLKHRIGQLFEYVKTLIPGTDGRGFCDTAPVLERYWAAKAGLGFIGKNTMLIVPKKGSYVFLGELIIDRELEYDSPLKLSCGKCARCMDACPTKAIEKPYLLNSNKCISYQTIENRGIIPEIIRPFLNNRVYGCDICQQICPWNRYAKPHATPEFLPKDEFLKLDWEVLEKMDRESYLHLFKGSAIKRAKFEGLKRNIEALKK